MEQCSCQLLRDLTIWLAENDQKHYLALLFKVDWLDGFHHYFQHMYLRLIQKHISRKFTAEFSFEKENFAIFLSESYKTFLVFSEIR